MALDAFHRDDDPGLGAFGFEGGGSIDVKIGRRPTWPERAMKWIWWGFWVIWWATIGASIAASVLLLWLGRHL